VGDWQTSGSIPVGGLTGSSGGVTGLFGASGGQFAAPGATVVVRAVPGDADLRLAEAFQAPEQIFTDKADRIRLDLFALGALSYYILTGQPPAANRAALRERLRRENGLDLAADLPQVTVRMRKLILNATRPSVSERLADIRTFLAHLDKAEFVLLAPEEAETPDVLDASPGSLVDGRYRLERRLGSGSTAVGLLVTDEDESADGPDRRRVLKVALDDAAATRLEREAEVLADLDNPHIVRLVAGPVRIGGRIALVLERAGEQTLAEILRERERLSLDMQERFGTDLLEALVVLDRAGIDHRDIKPSNLGVREDRTRRAEHLVLFDFSLSRADATAVTAGTQHYLDPFLEDPGRGRFDSAAERYSAAVVLFEMATGSVPRFGDGLSDPASLTEEATIEPEIFAPAVAGQLTGFFRKALARKASQRFDTAADMLAAWQTVFAPVPKSVPDDADRRAADARPETPLTEAGLSARALSALEPHVVHTVADLIAVDPVRLNHISGVAEPTRREVKSRANQWRRLFGASMTGRDAEDRRPFGPTLPDPVSAAESLVEQAGSQRAQARRRLASMLVGLDPAVEPFVSQSELAAILRVTPARIAQQMGQLQEAWAADDTSRAMLDSLATAAAQLLTDFDGVATLSELTGAFLSALSQARTEPKLDAERIAAGLLRLALDRTRALSLADEDTTAFATRRRAGAIALIASDPALLDPAEAIARKADDLLARAQAAAEQLVPAQRAVPQLQSAWVRATDTTGVEAEAKFPVPGPDRLLRLAAALSETAALSGARDLHARDLAPAVALMAAIQGAASLQRLTQKEIQDRYRARFPALAPLPGRPRLDELIHEAGLGLRYDEQQHAFRPLTRAGETSQLGSRNQTQLREGPPDLVSGGRVGHRLAESTSSRSFLALGIDADRLDRAVDVLTRNLGAVQLDVTQLLIEAMRQQATAAGLPWKTVRAADAAPHGSREAQGLAVLVQRSLPAIEAAIDDALAAAPDATRPVLLTDIAPLARYGHLNTLAPRADLATRRPQAIWVEVPQLQGNLGPVIDGRPLPLAAPGQYFRLDSDWLDRQPRSSPGDDS
jgi:serine/threonine protein kinase